jgi:hypothetical protein
MHKALKTSLRALIVIALSLGVVVVSIITGFLSVTGEKVTPHMLHYALGVTTACYQFIVGIGIAWAFHDRRVSAGEVVTALIAPNVASFIFSSGIYGDFYLLIFALAIVTIGRGWYLRKHTVKNEVSP